MPKKKSFLFFLLVIGSLTLMTYQSRGLSSVPMSSIRSVLNNTHMFIQTVSDAVSSPFRSLFARDGEKEALRRRVDELTREQSRYQETVMENKRLRELLRLRDRWQNPVASARIIARGLDHWTNTFVIDKGTEDGVQKDMTAVTPKGLAGKVLSVSSSYATILLLTDINFSASVRLQESRQEGVVSGTGSRNILLKYLPHEKDVKVGDILITSGLDLLFPPGIPVGYVTLVNRSGSGHFLYIEAAPYVEGSQIEEVLIVR